MLERAKAQWPSATEGAGSDTQCCLHVIIGGGQNETARGSVGVLSAVEVKFAARGGDIAGVKGFLCRSQRTRVAPFQILG